MIGGLLFVVGRWLVGSQVGQVVLIVTAALIGLAGWTWQVARDVRAAAMERVLKETAKESSRRLQELNAVAIASAAREAALAQAESERAKLIRVIHASSQANNGRACLDNAGVLRLDSLRGRPPGRGTRKPSR